MDPLLDDDVATHREATPSEKLRQALELMELGLRLKRQYFRARFPDASEQELQEVFERWLTNDD